MGVFFRSERVYPSRPEPVEGRFELDLDSCKLSPGVNPVATIKLFEWSLVITGVNLIFPNYAMALSLAEDLDLSSTR